MYFTMPPRRPLPLDLPLVTSPDRRTFLAYCDRLPLSVLDRTRRLVEHSDIDGIENDIFAYILLKSGEIFKLSERTSKTLRIAESRYTFSIQFKPINVLANCEILKTIIFDSPWSPLQEVAPAYHNMEAGDVLHVSFTEEIRSDNGALQIYALNQLLEEHKP